MGQLKLSISLFLQGTWFAWRPKKRLLTDINRSMDAKKYSSRNAYVLAAINGRKPDLMTDMHVVDSRLQGLRKNDRRARAHWMPDQYEQSYAGQPDAPIDQKIELYNQVLGLSRPREQNAY